MGLLLKNVWKILMKDLDSSVIRPSIKKRLLFLRNSLHNFLAQFQQYIYFFVIESSWNRLMNRLTKVETFNNIFKVSLFFAKKIVSC